ncbi:hypothetical protein AB4Z40_35755, partial [Bosea sp. 2YAB26]|uniref:hypothetical protein n=1 Tax=Bosea sp. 2YAB26 TaxID=3237478 RepID=UPI003F939789
MKLHNKGEINIQLAPKMWYKGEGGDIVKYLIAILIVVLILIFFPQILGVFLGSALVLAII